MREAKTPVSCTDPFASSVGPSSPPITLAPETLNSASPIARVEREDGPVLLTKRISTSPLVGIQLSSLGGVTAASFGLPFAAKNASSVLTRSALFCRS